MKSLVEHLKVNSKSKITNHLDRQILEDWSIKEAEDGDIVNWNSTGAFFIYKCLNEGKKYTKASAEAIVYHVAYDFNIKHLTVGPDTGFGTPYEHPENFKLASIDKCEELFEVLKKNGYEWDENHKELIKL